jgi:hypothetical protein
MVGLLVNKGLDIMWMNKVEILDRNFPGDTEENPEKGLTLVKV